MTADDAIFNNDPVAGGLSVGYCQPKRQKGPDNAGRNRFNSLSSAIMDITRIENARNSNGAMVPGPAEHQRVVTVRNYQAQQARSKSIRAMSMSSARLEVRR